MVYNFDTNVAKEYGINEAVMIANFQFWISKNKANGKNFIDGHYWTYNSKRAFLELFPFWSEQNIKTILGHLKDKGVIITANYNTSQYDRTLWYAFVDEDRWLNNIKDSNISLSENQPIHKLELTNGKVESNQPIPDIIPDNKPNTKNNTILSSKPDDFDTRVVELWNSIAEKYKLAKVSMITPARHKAILARMKEHNFATPEDLFDRIRQAIKESMLLKGRELVDTPYGPEIRNKSWRSSFDFFICQPSSLLKALEGAYADPDLVR